MTTDSTSPASSEWAKPSFRPAHIDQLISGVDRYNPQNLEILHEYLGQQLDSGNYDCLANLAILKLYQFNPAEFNYAVVVNVLTKALTAAPNPDFNLCLALLGEAPLQTVASLQPVTKGDEEEEENIEGKVTKSVSPSASADIISAPSAGNLADATILRLAKLSGLLSSARFREFWTLLASQDYEDVRGYASAMNGFDDSIRSVVVASVTGAFRSISLNRLGGYLNLQGSDLTSFVGEQAGWKVAGEKVTLPANLDNEVRATVIREDISLDQLQKFIAQAQPPRVSSSTGTAVQA